MKKFSVIAILWFLINPVFSQPNVMDSIKQVLIQHTSDTAKIDKLNQFVIQFAPSHPEIVLLYSDTAIKLSEKLNDSNRLAFSINRKGVALYYLGDYNASLENYFQAIRIKEKSGLSKEIWREYNNIGLVLRIQEQNDEALRYFNMCLSLIESEDIKYRAVVWNNIGISYRGLKQYDNAEQAIKKALEINTRISEVQAMAHNYNNLGLIHFNKKDHKSAIEYFKKALKVNRDLFNNYEVAQNLNNLSMIYLDLKNYKLAFSYIKELEEITNSINSVQVKLDFYNTKSNYFSDIKEFQQALIYKEKFVSIKDSIFSLGRIKQFNQLKTLANAEKEIQKLEFLEKINALQDEKIKNQKYIQFASGIVFILILLILFIVLRNLKIKKKLNSSLREHSDELSNLNKELIETNDELHNQREELETTLQSLKNAQQKLIQAEKMASLGILSSGIAHEINNPLNFIQGGIEGIETYFNENLKDHLIHVIPLINGIQTGVSRAAAIVTSLNQYTHMEREEKQECNLHEIIENCLVMLDSQTKDRITIHKNFDEKPMIMSGNESKLHQAILNILANSCQAIENEGTIDISTKIKKEHLQIVITDSGSGIKETDMPKIFDPFFTTRDPGRGTGLGLSIAYNKIKEHNGTIQFSSKSGKGTSVIIQFPIYF